MCAMNPGWQTQTLVTEGTLHYSMNDEADTVPQSGDWHFSLPYDTPLARTYT